LTPDTFDLGNVDMVPNPFKRARRVAPVGQVSARTTTLWRRRIARNKPAKGQKTQPRRGGYAQVYPQLGLSFPV